MRLCRFQGPYFLGSLLVLGAVCVGPAQAQSRSSTFAAPPRIVVMPHIPATGLRVPMAELPPPPMPAQPKYQAPNPPRFQGWKPPEPVVVPGPAIENNSSNFPGLSGTEKAVALVEKLARAIHVAQGFDYRLPDLSDPRDKARSARCDCWPGRKPGSYTLLTD